MGKLLFWVVAIVVIWSVLTLIRISQRKQERAQADAEAGRRSGAPGSGGGAGGKTRGTGGRVPERIVACAHCGVYLPYSDAVRGRSSDSGHYCCVEHRDAVRR